MCLDMWLVWSIYPRGSNTNLGCVQVYRLYLIPTRLGAHVRFLFLHLTEVIHILWSASSVHSHCVPFRRCIKYSTSTSFVKGITQS